jgi:ABC-type oligopeptide transport system ATPase subunit
MYVGYIVEMAKTDKLYFTPKHPYTEALLNAIPKADPRLRTRPIRLQGEVPSPAQSTRVGVISTLAVAMPKISVAKNVHRFKILVMNILWRVTSPRNSRWSESNH